MALGIRSKLALSFVLVILFPIATTIGSLIFGMYQFNKDVSSKKLEQINETNQIVVAQIINNYEHLGHDDDFYNNLEPILVENQLELQIFNNSGELMFDSSSKGSYNNPAIEIGGITDSISQTTVPIAINNKIVGNAVITTKDPGIINYFHKLYISIGISLGAGLLSILILIFLLTSYISRSVLKPLKELNMAAGNIAQGNLDFEINYRANDELGFFSRAFNDMRIKLKESLQKQHDNEKSRKEMVASISHDLRTPIASIKGYVEGLHDGVARNEEMIKRYLYVIRDKTEQLDRLIDDLFQYSQLDLGKLEMNLVPENSREMLEWIYGRVEMELDKNIISIERPIPETTLQSDRFRVEQVIINLVQNARQHIGDGGFIKIGSTLKNDYLIVSVQDNGPGISDIDLPHIFERFYRGEKSRSREYGGTGLGLAICKYIVEAHGGEIGVDSVCGEGSTFYFSLPVQR